jgi:transglutaminase-like putative cysteine protease
VRALPRGTDGSLLASLPWTISALVVSITPHIPYLDIWITAAFVCCAIWRYVIERQRRMLPSRWLRSGLALVCFLGVFATYSSISGVGPGSALLAIMAALKLLETRKRRDQFVLLFICIFLVMSSLLREQYLWSLPYLIGSTLVILTAWLRMSAGESETAKQSFATGGRLLLYAAPLAIAMWIFFPRLASPFWAVPIDTSRADSGLSNTMSPGDISELSMSDEVAFRVKFDGPVPEPRDRYWRGLVMTQFNGRTWSGPEPGFFTSLQNEISYSGEPVSYEVTLEPTNQNWVFALDLPDRQSLPGAVRMGRQQQLTRNTPIEQRFVYHVVSYPKYFLEATLSNQNRRWYTSVPDRGNARSSDLAQQMRASAGSDTAYIDAVLTKFRTEEYFYTLQPPPLGNNPVDRFLFDTRQGFCEHYASAFSFMMRAAGIPARIVLGYQGGQINPFGGHLTVRQSDAHAWTEVWLDRYGWYRIDPTAAVAPERVDLGARGAVLDGIGETWGFAAPSLFLQDLTMTWDALNAKWNEWVLGYGPDTQNSFMEWLGMNEPTWRKMLLTLVAIVVGLVLVISGLMMLRYRSPSKDGAFVLYQKFVRKSGIEMRVGETAQDFAFRAKVNGVIPIENIESVTLTYLDARYGPDDEQAITRLRTAVGQSLIAS